MRVLASTAAALAFAAAHQAVPAAAHLSVSAAQGERWAHCVAGSAYDPKGITYVSEPFLTDDPSTNYGNIWKGRTVKVYYGTSSDVCSNLAAESQQEPFKKAPQISIFDSREDLELSRAQMRENKAIFPNVVWVPWTPSPAESKAISSNRQTKTIAFRAPNRDDRGFTNVVFDVEHQFLTCMGELHIAYSLVENSVGIGRLAGGGERVLVNGGRGPASYSYEGKVYKVEALPETILSLPLKGSVWRGFQDQPLGTFADDAAAKALGFGCFSGQTKKIANLKDLYNGDSPTKDQVEKLLGDLKVSIETSQILTSSAAEEEIRSGLAKTAADERERSGQAGLDAAAEDRARRKAERDAEYAARQAKYEEALAAQQKAVAEYEAAKLQMEADKATAAARAKATLDAYAQQRAAYEAEAQAVRDRNAQLQADYEARARKAGIKLPKN